MHNPFAPGKTNCESSEKICKVLEKVLDFFQVVRIIIFVREIEDLCNGSTPDSDSVCGGSNPSSSAKKDHTKRCGLFWLSDGDSTPSKCGADERRARRLDGAQP